MAHTATILSVRRAQYRAHAFTAIGSLKIFIGSSIIFYSPSSFFLSLLFHKYDRRATLATPFRDLIASINVQVILSEPLLENSIDGRN